MGKKKYDGKSLPFVVLSFQDFLSIHIKIIKLKKKKKMNKNSI